jgi:hypothetical protein
MWSPEFNPSLKKSLENPKPSKYKEIQSIQVHHVQAADIEDRQKSSHSQMAYSIHKKEKMKADVSTETRMSKDNGRLFKILVEKPPT